MKLSSKFKSFVKTLRNQDIFGHQINLTYRKHRAYKSILGGILTVIFGSGIAALLIFEMTKVFQQKLNITSSSFVRDVATDMTIYDFDSSKFDIGFYINVFNETVEYAWADGGGSYIENYIPLPLAKCTDKNEGFDTSYLCAQNLHWKLMGGFASNQNMYVRLFFYKCIQSELDKKSPGKKCAPISEIDYVFNRIEIYFPMKFQFVDINDPSTTPIKHQTKSYLFLTDSLIAQYYTFKISQNFLILNDSPLYSEMGQSNQTYYQIAQDAYQAQRINPGSCALGLYFLLDEQVNMIQREVYTLSDALSVTGGFLEIIHILIGVLIAKFQQNMFYQRIIKDMYMIKRDPQDRIKKKAQKAEQQQSKESQNINDTEKGIDSKPGTRLRIMPHDSVHERSNEDATVRQSLEGIKEENNSKEMKKDSRMSEEDSKDTSKQLVDQGITEESDKSKYRQLIEQVKNKARFIYSIKECLLAKLRRNQRDKQRFRLYKKAIKKLEQNFEVLHLFKQMKTSQFLAQIFLAKYQKEMMPYFRSNLIDDNSGILNRSDTSMNGFDDSKSSDDDSYTDWEKMNQFRKAQLKQYLIQAILLSKEQKVDQRLLKNLDSNAFTTQGSPRRSTVIGGFKQKMMQKLQRHSIMTLNNDLGFHSRQDSLGSQSFYTHGRNTIVGSPEIHYTQKQSTLVEKLRDIQEIDKLSQGGLDSEMAFNAETVSVNDMKFSLAASSRQPTYNAQQNKLNMNRHIMKFTDFRLNGNKSPITNNKNPSQAFMNKFNFSSQDKANLGNEDKHAYESIDRMMFPSNDHTSQVKTDMDFNTNTHTNTVVNFNSTTNLNNFNGTQGLGNQTLNKNNSQQLLLGNYQTLNSAIQNYSRNAPTTQAAPYRLETFNIQKNPNAQSIETPQHQHEPIILSDQNNSNQIPNLSHQLIFKTTIWVRV
eukprot:403346959